MKEIGRTNDGAYLVEMSQEEATTFAALESTITGNFTLDTVFLRNKAILGRDLAPVLQAIRRWCELQFLLNDMDQRISELRSALEGEAS